MILRHLTNNLSVIKLDSLTASVLYFVRDTCILEQNCANTKNTIKTYTKGQKCL